VATRAGQKLPFHRGSKPGFGGPELPIRSLAPPLSCDRQRHDPKTISQSPTYW
jgi:hypothetical protein